MTKLQAITNQELLTELSQRLPNFTPNEWTILVKTASQYQSQIEQVFQSKPEFYCWYQEKKLELEQKMEDKKVDKLAKLLKDKEKK